MLDDGKSLGDFGTSSTMTDAVLSQDGRSILLSQQTAANDHPQQRLSLWEVGTATPAKMVLVPADSETFIRDFSSQAKLAAATTKDGFVLYSLESGEEVQRYKLKQIKSPYGFRLSPDGKLAIVIGDDPNDNAVAFLIDTASGNIERQFEDRGSGDDTAHATDGAFSPDGRQFAVGYFDGTAELWDTRSQKRVKQFPAVAGDNADRVWSLRFTSDGKKMISGSRDSGAFLWNLETTRPPRAFLYDDMSAMHPYLAGVALSHDGSTVVAGSSQHAMSSGDTGRQRSIDVWNAANGKSRGHWLAHDYGVTVVTFSPDDRWIISASRDGTIKYWNAETHKCIATIVVSNDGHWFVLSDSGFFSGNPGDGNLLSVSRGTTVRPWSDFREKLDRPDLIAALLKGDPDHRYAAAARGLDLRNIWEAAVH
jgi:WD40 repeat protein